MDTSIGQQQDQVVIRPIRYRGAFAAYLVTNGVVEAVVVPPFARVMQLRFAGEAEGIFWENRSPDAGSGPWRNHGGDKTWPAPQTAWPAVMGRPWPPPDGFDGVGFHAEVQGEVLTLTSPIDAHYGIRVERRITLERGRPQMVIHTRYDKRQGPPVSVGVWVITQVEEGLRSYMLLDEHAASEAVRQTMGDGAPHLLVVGRLVGWKRDPLQNVKLEAPGQALMWVSTRHVLRIDTRDRAGGAIAGNLVALYGNMDPQPYVELETQGPEHRLEVGDSLEQTNIYTLSRRALSDPQVEARRAFNIS
jgi:hypothetical protein